MLVHNINITDEDIKYAENILLKEGQTFEDRLNERIAFIKDLTTLDLQAVPGSGKTTVLLAKLLILERYLPFDDGSGILIISHTNTAIDEIKNKIGNYCPKLFSYPNFIGTIQSFVNKFLSIPFYKQILKKKINIIDNITYDETVSKYILPYGATQWVNRLRDSDDFKKSLRFNDNVNLIEGINGLESNFRLKNKESPTYKALYEMKLNILKAGILHFDDMYFLANRYLVKKENIIDILRKRFTIVFIDEMQDMDKIQHDLLEKMFFINSETIFQRIGDKNQAIYNGGNIETDVIWQDREKVLNLTGTNRFSQTIATFVQNFGIINIPINSLQNSGEDLKPHLFIYKDENIQDIIPKYSQLIRSYVNDGLFQIDKEKPFKAIAWIKEHETKIALKNYFENFEENQHKVKENYKNLKSYLVYFERGNGSFKGIKKSILNALVKILKLENTKDENDRFYTRKSLINIISEKQKEQKNSIYDDFNLNIYKWCKKLLVTNNLDITFNEIKEYIPIFLNIFEKSIVNSRVFINDESLSISANITSSDIKNIYNQDGFDIHISTVHSVKGETHTATLYLESSYYSEYESQRLLEQFKNVPFNNPALRHTQSTKMAYVGFSRPTHLLCIAIHEDRFDSSLDTLGSFEIIYI
ncbi:UvrD-helicase domain-containing protein [Aliarcobacter butzleri]|uniref:UvrD-helicase domain-containing protein n=1 Tax=Aliarcobacter butzleri TaxID=28197 RepID=UPI003AF9B36B